MRSLLSPFRSSKRGKENNGVETPSLKSPTPKRPARFHSPPLVQNALNKSPTQQQVSRSLFGSAEQIVAPELINEKPATRDASTQTINVPALSFEDELDRKDPGRELQLLVSRTLHVLANNQKSKHLAKLSLRNRVEKYFRLPNSRTRAAKDLTKQATQQAVAQSKLLGELFEHLFTSNSQATRALDLVAPTYDFAVIPEATTSSMTIAQAVAFRDRIPTTTNGLYRAATGLADIQPVVGKLLFQKQLKLRVKEYERCNLEITLGYEMVPLEMGGEKNLSKPCLHVWVKNPPVIIEGLTKSALVSGKFRNSSDISKHNNKIMVVQGSDKGGCLTVNLLRIANRIDGNAPAYCFPTAFYEDARESYANLASTILSEGKPTKQFLQHLVSGLFHLLTVAVRVKDEVVDVECLCLHFIGVSALGDDLRLATHLEQDADYRELANETEAKAREQPATIQLQDCHRARYELAIRLVAKEKERNGRNNSATPTTKTYIGFQLYQIVPGAARSMVHMARFADELVLPSKGALEFNIAGILCFTSDDLKLNTCVHGQGTASSKHPCPICIADKHGFLSSLVDPSKPHPLRKGQYDNFKLYENFESEAKSRKTKIASTSDKASMVHKTKAKSVVHKPLLVTPPDFNAGASMHVSQGLMTHLTKAMLNLLKAIDRKAHWRKQLTVIIKDAKNKRPWLENKLNDLYKCDRQYERKIKEATQWCNNNSVPGVVRQKWIATQQQYHEERESFAKDNAIAAWAHVQQSAALFVDKGEKFLKDSGSRPEGEASYMFLQSYQIDCGVLFRVENSGIELTNANGFRVLARADAIANRVDTAYSNNPSLNSEAKAIMSTCWRPMAKLLLEISTLLKRQDKLTIEDISRLKECSTQYGKLWTQLPSSTGGGSEPRVFNKLHTLVDHITCFAERHACVGLVNEEGFEATHPRLHTVSSHLKCMVSTSARAEKIVQRLSLGLNDEYQEAAVDLKEARLHPELQNKRGGKSDLARKLDDSIAVRSVADLEMLPKELAHVLGGTVVLKEWKEYYEYLVCGRVPAAFSAIFQSDPSLGSVQKIKSEFVHNH
ncbi:hypothetical protein SEMRO_588_G171580.1 [Seminavis robusta]|uniref:Uncharacterized protein n=1 Tax=Seminavis robusta TaxID=568900 RepID=A0A9N8E3S7_9STRA|nr:hypothetical protein SEMRO_588_G171580.1 [Seminavis robusta]|eukprot:Sro588_g171580.1 n/a (1067) ;mRNA; r:49591-52791